ncbi:PLD nuclease N-terminal domain-containing protein [Phytopseudomonas dryadis]|uniref:Cardiolipin synthase N-terminal domain-containing protein n=1 Tax=Phytopseudomonas dryadis TaxID=2487520 RepID=A0ABY1Z5L3_9GAMM|nr:MULTISPECIES: PLD nuclease N-terminal domain-containing protein [Pseudomonas]TBV05370.1 hypothetical protein DNK34_12545 [Pseudomonas dryadis]TBV18380.1 hypothetical protein DNK41_08335 [Pseudomonas sp. FRB 230]
MSDPTWYFWLAVVVILAFIDLVVILNLSRSSAGHSAKLAWSLAIVLLPVIGLIAWGFAGPRGMPNPPSSPEQSK